MTVYVESNYLLELAFEREQATDCAGILALAEGGRITLALPAFSVGECFERLGRRRSRRVNIRESLREEIRELGRSPTGAPLSGQLRTLSDALVAGADAEAHRYDAVLGRLLACATFIPLDADAIRDSLAARTTYDLSRQDAIILSCVFAHLAATTPDRAVFINRNRRDFANHDIVAALDARGCALKTEFRAGLAHVTAALDSP